MDATIEDLKLNTTAKLTPMIKNKLVEVLNNEFSAQRTKHNYSIQDRKNKLLEDYKRKVKHSAKVSKINKAQAQLDQAQKELYRTGLCEAGSVKNFGFQEEI